MSIATIRVIIYCLIGLSAYFAVRLVYLVLNKSDAISEYAANRLKASMESTSSFYFNPKRLTKFMSNYGYFYKHKDYEIEPSTFVVSKIFAGVIGAGVGYVTQTFASGKVDILDNWIFVVIFIVLGSIIGFFAPDITTKHDNAAANEDMMKDIQKIYGYMQIYAKSNVYITDMISNCYTNAKNPRLKAGLKELLYNLVNNKMTPQEAIDIFESRFKNKYISNLCVILKQSLETGRASNMIENVNEYINSIQKAMDMKKRNKIETVLLLCIIGVFALIVTACMLGVTGSMSL